MRGFGSCLLLALGLGMLAPSGRAEAPVPLEVLPEQGRVPAWQALRIVAPPDRQLGPQQAADLAAGPGAIRVDSPQRVVGRGQTPYWALFSLRNASPSAQLRLVAIEGTTQSDGRLYERSDAGAWRQLKSLSESAAGRFGAGTTHPVWPVELAPGATVELMLRIEGPAVVRFPVFVYHPLAWAERERPLHLLAGVALGSCMFVSIFVGWPRRDLDDGSVDLFFCMLLADLIGALWLTGFLSELFPGVTESVLSLAGFAAYSVLFGSACLHARVYLNTAAWAPYWDRVLSLAGWAWLGVAPWFAFVFLAGARIVLLWGGTAIALMLVLVSSIAAYRRIPLSGYIFAAWLTYLLLGSLFLAARISESPGLWAPSSFALVQAVMIAIFFGLATSQRLLRQRREMAAARHEALLEREKSAALMHERSRHFAATNHDLRQPLVGIGIFADLLKSARTVEERDKYLRKLDMALKEVDGFLSGAEQLAAASGGLQGLERETVTIDSVLAPIIEEYRGRSKHKRIVIRYVPSGLTITTHVAYLQRIVRNVLSNAIRHSGTGDRIVVGCRRGDGLRLAIIDSGAGMTEIQVESATRVFRDFDPGMVIPAGFGLGLFSVGALAKALGLQVSLRSPQDKGTEFNLFLGVHPVQLGG